MAAAFGRLGLKSLGVSAVLLASVFVAPVRAQVTPPGAERVDEAVDRGLAHLLSQQRADGAIADAGNAHAMTALSVMAFAAAGHLAADPTPEGKTIRKALDYLLRPERQRDDGYFGGDGSRMYGHGIVTLLLAEALDMGVDADQDALIRRRLRKGLDLILWAQDRKGPSDARNFGGWRYSPDARDSDLSVTIWQIMALRAARNAGVDVPRAAIEKAVAYLRSCYSAGSKGRGGAVASFHYQPGKNATYAAAAAGLLAMQVCGLYDADEVQGAADALLGRTLDWNGSYFLYGTYYYAQGMFQKSGRHADHARREVETLLLARQRDDGAWLARQGAENKAGTVYCTAMAALSLCVKYHYLPIYQR